MIKAVLKIFLAGLLLVVVVVAGISIYMKFYGNKLIEKQLSQILGTKMKFAGISLDLKKYSINFTGFSIPSEVGFEARTVFNADRFVLVLDKEKFEKDKKFVINEAVIEKGTFNIERNKQGVFNVSCLPENEGPAAGPGTAYAADTAGNTPMPFYNFAKSVKRILIQKSTINFKDYYISKDPLSVTCANFYTDIRMSPEEEASRGAIPMKYDVSFDIPRRGMTGQFFLHGEAAIHQDRVDTEAVMDTKNIDMMQFLPYFSKATPFYFYEGEFNSTTSIAIHNKAVKSTTTMLFYKLRLEADPEKRNASFLQVSVNKLVPYLTSGKGEIIFDFEINGPLEHPEVGLGPNVKMAIGAVVVDEFGKILQQFQKMNK